MLDELKKKVRKLLEKGETEAALKTLLKCLHQDSPHFHSLLVRQGEFALANKQLSASIINTQEWEEQQHKINHALLLLLDQLGISDLRWQLDMHAELKRAVNDLPLRILGILDLVNCGRHSTLSRALEFLRVDRDSNSHFFFLLGHETQRLSSFAERLAYEIAQPTQADKNEMVDFEQEPYHIGEYTLDRLRLQPLPSGLSISTSQQMFKRYLGKRLQKYGLEAKLETLVSGNVQQKWPFAALTFAFTINEVNWNDQLLAYLEWLVQTFGSRKSGKGPAFYFFFIIGFQDEGTIAQHRITRSLQKMIREQVPNNSVLLTDYAPVSVDDVADWLRKVSPAANPTQIQEVVQQFCEVLKQQNQWGEHTDINIMQVEALQEIVFQRQLKAQFPHVILPV